MHHSRIQEWSALGVVTGAHVALLQLLQLLVESKLDIKLERAAGVAFFLGALFALLGSLLTLRHRHLMQVKLRWIYAAEIRLGLVATADNPAGVIVEANEMPDNPSWKGLSWPRFLSTSWLMLALYALFLLLDLTVVGNLVLG